MPTKLPQVKNAVGGINKIQLASVSIELYHQHKLQPSKSLEKLASSVIKNDRDLKKQVVNIVRDVPSNMGIDTTDIRTGTLNVARYIHRKLGLDFTKFTLAELRNLMINVVMKKAKKKEGCDHLGLSESSLDNYFKTVGSSLNLDNNQGNLRTIQRLYVAADEESEQDKDNKRSIIVASINKFELPIPGRPTLLPATMEDMFMLHEGGKANHAAGVSKTLMAHSYKNYLSNIAELCENVAADDPNYDLLQKKAEQLRSVKVVPQTISKMKIRLEERNPAVKGTFAKSSGISQKRAKAANPLTHHNIKAFGGTVIDPNGNGYKLIKLQELKQNLYQVVIDSINSNPNVDYDDDDMSIDS